MRDVRAQASRLANRLRRHGIIQDRWTTMRRFGYSEHEIKLDLILKPGSTVTHEELARFINANAPHFCVPRYIECRGAALHADEQVQKYKLRERGVTPQSWDRLAAGFGIER